MRISHICVAAAAAFGLGSAAHAVTYTLTFDASVACGSVACANYSAIDQAYGDTAIVDLSYQRVNNPGDAVGFDSLAYWDTGYGDLVDVAWGAINDNNGASQIIFTPAAGYTVTLISLDIAGWPNTDRPTQSILYDGNYNFVASTGAFTAPGTGHQTLNCNGAFCTQSGLVLEWGPNGYNVGVDNVVFSINAVPEPASWALMIAGFGLVGAGMRRRRSVIA